jgi:hypothetical protein
MWNRFLPKWNPRMKRGEWKVIKLKHKHTKGTRQTSIVLVTATVPTCVKTKVWAKTGHRYCEKHRFLLCCPATRTTVCQPVLIITAVLLKVTLWWMKGFGVPNGTRLLKLITFCYPVCYAVRTHDECRHSHGQVKCAVAINTWIGAALVHLFGRSPWGWHSGAEKCMSRHHELYFIISILMSAIVG